MVVAIYISISTIAELSSPLKGKYMLNYNELMKEKSDARRVEFIKLHDSGASYSEIAKANGISTSRVGQIIKGEKDMKAAIPLDFLLPDCALYSDTLISSKTGVSKATVSSWRVSGVMAMHVHRFVEVEWPEVDPFASKSKTTHDANERRSGYVKYRFAVLLRDGFKCQYCGATKDTDSLHVDHIVPFSKGGKNTMDNLITSCSRCNHSKRDYMMDTKIVEKFKQP